jgi:hypothetical protein
MPFIAVPILHCDFTLLIVSMRQIFKKTGRRSGGFNATADQHCLLWQS